MSAAMHTEPARLPRTRARDLPIEVFLGDPAFDFGMTSIPTIFLRFYRHLSSAGQFIGEAEAMALVHLLSRDATLRATPEQTRRLEQLRELGLVFALRSEDPRRQVWDVRSLFYNLERIGAEWQTRQQPLLAQWQRGGRSGPRPNLVLPADYTWEVQLPGDVCADIRSGMLHPVPTRWQEYARQALAAR